MSKIKFAVAHHRKFGTVGTHEICVDKMPPFLEQMLMFRVRRTHSEIVERRVFVPFDDLRLIFPSCMI